MATTARKRRAVAKKTAAKKTSNSKVAEVTGAAAKKSQGDSLRGLAGMERARTTPSPYSVADGNAPALNPAQPVPPSPGVKTNPGYPGDPNYKSQKTPPAGPLGTAMSAAAQGVVDRARQIPGLATPVNQPSAITNPSLYGASNKDRASRLQELVLAVNDTQSKQLKDKGNAVFMGSVTAKIRNKGPNRFDDTGGTTTTEGKIDQKIYSKDQLMGWLADDAKVAQIKAAMQKAGLDVQTYDDIAKLWASVLDTAANAYSVNGQRVTPWDVLTLRGKHTVNGRLPDKTSTQTTFDQMDPLTARKMFEDTAQQALGRAPSKAEVDDFIAKAQTIAHSNPTVTKTVSQMNFDGTVKDQQSSTTGGVSSQGYQQAAMDQARQSEDYAAYQAAGNYFPMLFQALKSPV